MQVVRVASMWDQNLKVRLDASQAHAASLHAEVRALQASNSALEAEVKQHDDDLATTIEQFSREKARISKNYQQLYETFQKFRSQDRKVLSLPATHSHSV
jgi:cell division protein FtsB